MSSMNSTFAAFLLLILSSNATASQEIGFLHKPSGATKAVFDNLRLYMRDVLENLAWEVTDQGVYFYKPNGDQSPAPCSNETFEILHFEKKFDGLTESRLHSYCKGSVFTLSFIRPQGELPLTSLDLISFSWTQKLESLSEYSIEMQRFGHVISRKKSESQDVWKFFLLGPTQNHVLSIEKNWVTEGGREISRRIITKTEIDFDLILHLEVQEYLIPNSLPRRHLFDNLDRTSKEISLSEFAMLYQNSFQIFITFLIPRALF